MPDVHNMSAYGYERGPDEHMIAMELTEVSNVLRNMYSH